MRALWKKKSLFKTQAAENSRAGWAAVRESMVALNSSRVRQRESITLPNMSGLLVGFPGTEEWPLLGTVVERAEPKGMGHFFFMNSFINIERCPHGDLSGIAGKGNVHVCLNQEELALS